MAYEDQGLAPADLREARRRVAKGARVTPLLPSEGLSERAGRPVYLKCENLQVGGAFKIRGATNFLSRAREGLPPRDGAPPREGVPPGEGASLRGVITYSSGNHGVAVAIAARRAGVPAVVVMPGTAPSIKLDRVRSLGAEVHLVGPTSPERKSRAEALAAERDLTMVPPFDHPWIVAGQATCAVEILEQLPEVASVLVPVGGGGLIAGITLACGYHRAAIRVVGAEPEGAAKMTASMRAGAPVTLPAAESIADGLLPLRPGDLTFSIVQRFGAQMAPVSDGSIREAARWLLETEHLLVEWSGAAAVAALLAGAPGIPDGPAVAVLSGGNADPRAILAPPPEP